MTNKSIISRNEIRKLISSICGKQVMPDSKLASESRCDMYA
jgi:hypothetical protein